MSQGITVDPSEVQDVAPKSGVTVDPSEVEDVPSKSALPSAPGKRIGNLPDLTSLYHGPGAAPQTTAPAFVGAKQIAQGNVARGAHTILKAGGEALAPLAFPALVAAPVATLAGAAGSLAGAGIARYGAGKAGLTPDQQDVAGDVGAIVGGGFGGKFGEALPQRGRAAAGLNEVRSAAENIPVRTKDIQSVVGEIKYDKAHGGFMPGPVQALVDRLDDPTAKPLNYGELKDFQKNISRLSRNERGSMTADTARLVGKLNESLKVSLEDAASVVGKGQQFRDAMEEYHQAMVLRGFTKTAIKQALKAAAGSVGLYGLHEYFK